jgi:putative flippase GtrA
MKIKEKLGIVKYIIQTAGRLLLKYPRILTPFCFTALFYFLSLFFLYLAPMHPVRKLLGPPIARFFGGQYLHYPYNFILLPQLFSDVKNFIVNPFIFSLMIAVTAGMIYSYFQDKEPSFIGGLNRALRRYLHLILVVAIMTSLVLGITRLIPYSLRKIFPTVAGIENLSFYIIFLMVVAIESLFVYTFASLMIKSKNILGALKESLLFSKRFYLITYVLILIPRLLDLAAGILQRRQLFLMDKLMPDITLLILSIGILISILSNTLVYTLTFSLYSLKEKAENV